MAGNPKLAGNGLRGDKQRCPRSRLLARVARIAFPLRNCRFGPGVDSIAERIQLLGGVSIAMAPDVAETTRNRSYSEGAGRGSG